MLHIPRLHEANYPDHDVDSDPDREILSRINT